MPADAVADPGDELVDVVDGEVRLVGPALRREVRRRKLLHRSCAVLVRDVRSQIFVHRRTDTKDVFPGLYDMFVAGVVLSGESYEGAARRELMEELGSNPDDLRPLFRHRYDGPDNAQWTQVFEATCRRPPVLRTGGDRVGWVHERSRPGGEAGGLAVRPGRSRGLPPLPRAEGLMRHHLVFGDGWVTASLPDDTRVVSPGISLPLPPTPNLHREVRRAASRPLDGPPLRELARGARRVTVAFDDPTVPCYAPVWATAVPIVLAELESAGVPRDGIALLCANVLHRQFMLQELAALVGEDVVREFAATGRLSCHDAEDPDAIVHLGRTEEGHDVELNRAVVDSDLTVYVNASTTRGFSGGWKSVCVGLSSYRSIRHHHSPDTMSMSTEKNRMHEVLARMGEVVERELGPERIFKLETILSNPLQVHRVLGGSVAATRAEVLRVTRANQPSRRSLLEEKADVVVYGVPDWSPYAAFSYPNPILTLISTGLGYLGGMIEALGKPGCTAIMATPCPERWDDVHHPSYREVWERVLPVTRDPYEARELFEPELAVRPDYIEKYRTGFGFHPTHAVMALYPLKRLRHAGQIVVAGIEDPATARHLGFEPVPTVEDGLRLAEALHGPDPSVAVVPYPPAANRTL